MSVVYAQDSEDRKTAVDVTVVTESRFLMLQDNSIWTESSAGESFWKRYTNQFERIYILARCASADQPPPTASHLPQGRIKLVPLPHYIGPQQMLSRLPALSRAIRQHMRQPMAYIFRVPGWLGNLSYRAARRVNAPFAVEVVGDPYDVFGPTGGVRHPGRAFFRWWFSRELQLQCQQACAVSYVTRSTLQQRYPTVMGSFATHYSSIELPDSMLASKPPLIEADEGPIRVVSVGSLEQMYKGFDVLIDAVATKVNAGLDLKLTLVGDGRYRSDLEDQARIRGIRERVDFVGKVPRSEVISIVDNADLFVMPSRTEGLPRAMIEAMSRGKPCIGTNIGGIPELLEVDEMVSPDNADLLAEKIGNVVQDCDRRQQMAERNLQKAKAYSLTEITPRREKFYEFVKDNAKNHYENQ